MATTKKRASRSGSMAEFVDGLMMQGMTLDELFERASAESAKRGILRFTVRRKFDRHIASRERRTDIWKVTREGDRIKMTAVEPKAEKTPAAKREAKGLPPIVKRKNGKATGRKMTKTTENGRQTVEPVTTEPAPETEAA